MNTIRAPVDALAAAPKGRPPTVAARRLPANYATEGTYTATIVVLPENESAGSPDGNRR